MQQFFNVKKAVKIGRRTFCPAVSYKLTQELIPAVKVMEENNRAVITDSIIVFENGKPVDAEAQANEKAAFAE